MMTWGPIYPEGTGIKPPHKDLQRRLRAMDADILGNLFVSSKLQMGKNADNNTLWDSSNFQQVVFTHQNNASAAFNTDNPGILSSAASAGMSITPAYDDDESYAKLVVGNSGAGGNYGVSIDIQRDTSTATNLIALLNLSVATVDTATVPLRITTNSTGTANHIEVDGRGMTAPGILAMTGPDAALTMTTSLQTLVWDTATVVDDSYVTHSAGVFTLPDPGIYELHFNVTFESVDDTGGIRGAPVVRVQSATETGSYAQYAHEGAEYMREGASGNNHSAMVAWTFPIETTGTNWKIRARVFDDMTGIPNYIVPTSRSAAYIKRIR